jgi:hypothetical protein
VILGDVCACVLGAKRDSGITKEIVFEVMQLHATILEQGKFWFEWGFHECLRVFLRNFHELC